MLLTELTLISLLAFSYLIVSLPWLWKSSPRPTRVNVGRDITLFVSDLHLDRTEEAPREFVSVLDETKPASLIVVGDLFHSPSTVGSTDSAKYFVTDLLRKVDPRGLLRRVIVTMSENHDPRLAERETIFRVDGREVLLTCDPLIVETSSIKILAVHGDYFCNDGLVAAAVELVLSFIGVRGAIERFLRFKMNRDRSEWVVMGHTHIALVDEEHRVANCGSFHSHFLRAASDTAVLAKGGRVRLVTKGSNR
jgi:UDP-2,3-diacylglucosamine pyrophosphatase LpxH